MQPHEAILQERPFGEGAFPTELNRFSWGAFFLPFIWGLVYRSWPVLMAWVVGTTGPIVLFSAFGAVGENVPFAAFIAADISSEVISGIVRLWVGSSAFRLLWIREAALVGVASARPRFTVDQFIKRQRTWTIVGGSLLVAASAAAFPLLIESWRAYGLPYVGAAMSIMWLVAEVILALWLDRSMRKEPLFPVKIDRPPDEDGRRY